tara:strand:+ start:373 stop:810 length:438 start_codon:yes stop_codon:yes gene_type:complete
MEKNMKNLKFYLMASTVILLIGCGSEDSRADDKAMMVEKELEYGHVTKEEADCMVNVLSDSFSDEEDWATLISMYDLSIAESAMLGMGDELSAEEQKMMDISLKTAAVIPKIDSECNIDTMGITFKRMEDAGLDLLDMIEEEYYE